MLVLGSKAHTFYYQLSPTCGGGSSVREEGGKVCLEYKPIMQMILISRGKSISTTSSRLWVLYYIFMELTCDFATMWNMTFSAASSLKVRHRILFQLSVAVLPTSPKVNGLHQQPFICS